MGDAIQPSSTCLRLALLHCTPASLNEANTLLQMKQTQCERSLSISPPVARDEETVEISVSLRRELCKQLMHYTKHYTKHYSTISTAFSSICGSPAPAAVRAPPAPGVATFCPHQPVGKASKTGKVASQGLATFLLTFVVYRQKSNCLLEHSFILLNVISNHWMEHLSSMCSTLCPICHLSTKAVNTQAVTSCHKLSQTSSSI